MIEAKKNIQNLTPVNFDSSQEQWRLKLDENENIYGIANFIKSAIKNMDFKEISQHPKYNKLINKLSERYKINKNNIMLNAGSKNALINIFCTYLEKGDEVLSFCESLNEIKNFIYSQDIEIKSINNLEFSLDEFEKNVSNNTKIFYIPTPDNNTGKIISVSLIETLIKKYENILFVIDCSYINYANNVEIEDYTCLLKYDNVAIIKSFSCDFALIGLKLGYTFACEYIINNIKKIITDNVSSIAIECGCAILNNENSFEEIKSLNQNAKELFYNGLLEKGFKPYESESNFILCDFLDYSDFYYQKLKNSGVIVKKYDKSSQYSTCLRITVPTIGGVKYILELLNKKDLLIFDLDGVVFDIRESYQNAIIQTFKHFAGFEVTRDEIMRTKNLGGFNCDWYTTQYLLKEHGFEVDINDITKLFQDLFYNPKLDEREFLIDKEKLIITKEKFEELSKEYDLVIFSGRLDFEMKYSLKKFDIEKFFCYSINADNLNDEHLKPNPEGIFRILKHCPHKTVKYIGDSVDDIIAGNKAGVETIGVISPGADEIAMVNNFKHLCANYILKDINDLKNFLKKNEHF